MKHIPTLVFLASLFLLHTTQASSLPDIPQCRGELEGVQNVVTLSADAATSVVAVDIDSNGRVDLVVTAYNANTLAWYNNTDGKGTYGPAIVISSAVTGARTSVVADLDHDGIQDIAVAADTGDFLAWFRHLDGKGSFGTMQIITTATNSPWGLVAADLDGDSFLDLASVSTMDVRLAWYPNNAPSLGSFGSQIIIAFLPSRPRKLDAGDLDGDGDQDLAVVCSQGDTVAWFENLDGAGSFSPIHIVSDNAGFPFGLLLADLDGDGDLDMVVGADLGLALGWYENVDGEGTFTSLPHVISFADGAGVSAIAAGDLDGDGDLDIAAGPGDGVGWFANDGTGLAFGPQQILTLTASEDTSGVALADVDGDGDLDVVGTAYDDDLVAWYENNPISTPSFSSPIIFEGAAAGALKVIPGDVDNDGDLDLVVGLYYGSEVVWYENIDGAGTYENPTTITRAVPAVRGLVVQDFNGDGHVDVAASSYADKVVWHANLDGAGGFGPENLIAEAPVVDSTQSLASGDMDADGDIDLIVGSYDDDTIIIFTNSDALGTFVYGTLVTNSMNGVVFVGIHDVDGDGDLDVTGAARFSDTIAWFENSNGVGTSWTPHVLSTSLSDPREIAVGDLNSDGALDIAATALGSDQTVWFPNNGSGGFGAPLVVSTANNPNGIAAVDMDDDGDVDLLVTMSSQIYLFPNIDGTGVFDAHIVVATMVGASGVTPADLDSDGDLDIAVATSSFPTGPVGWISRLTRGPFFPYPPETYTHPEIPTGPFCGVPTSGACIRSSLASLSPCKRDTLVIPPGQYDCYTHRHALVTRNSILQAQVPGSVSFACQGGVLFQAASAGPSVGALELVGISVFNTGAGDGATTAVPGLRAEGPGATLSLVNSSVSSGSSSISPSLLGGGTGGCLLASNGGSLILRHSAVTNCSAAVFGGGGAAIGSHSSIVASHSSFTGNYAAGSGGALAVSSGGELDLTEVSISENSAGESGGGLSVDPDSTAGVLDGIMTRNVAGACGGALWASPQGTTVVRATRVAHNAAAVGGAVASTLNAASVGSAASVSDIPLASSDGTLAGPGGPGDSQVALLLVDVALDSNTASKFGGALFACDSRVVVNGSNTVWSSNVAQGSSPQARSSSDALLCALPPSSEFTLDRSTLSGIPWLRIQPDVAGGGSEWQIHGPIGSLEWSTLPPGQVEAGGSVDGVLHALDMFGLPVVYAQSVVSVVYDTTPVLPPLEVPDVFLSSESVSLPPVLLPVRLPGSLPVNVSFGVRVAQAPGSLGLGVDALVRSVQVGLCGVGRGGVVDEGLTSCTPCTAGTESLVVSLDSCVGLSVCPENSLRRVSNSTAVPCVCERGFWVPSGEVNQPCVPCPRGGICEGGVGPPVAGPGFFPAEGGSTLFLACPNADACLGQGNCKPGYRGRLCAECAPKYYALRGQCYKCDTALNSLVTLCLVLGALIACGLLLGFNLAEGMRYKFAAAMIGLSALQISAMYVAFYPTGVFVVLCCVVCCVLCVVLCCVLCLLTCCLMVLCVTDCES